MPGTGSGAEGRSGSRNAGVVVRPEEIFGSEVGTFSWSWNPHAHPRASTLSGGAGSEDGDQAGANEASGAVDPALEANFYAYAEEGVRRERNMFSLCFAPEGQLVAQSVLFVGVAVSAAVVLARYARGESASIALCVVMLVIMSLDVLRMATLVAVRRWAFAPSTTYLNMLLVNSYLGGIAAGGCFVAFMFTSVGTASLAVIILFVIESVLYLLCFGWFHAFMEIFLPLSAGLMFPIWLFLVPFKFLMNIRTEPPEPEPTVIVTQADVDESMPSAEYDATKPATVCAICIIDFEEGDPVRTLPCNHTFHTECIDPWFLSNHTTCPSCRKPFREEPADGEAKSGPAAADSDTDTDAESDGQRRRDSDEESIEVAVDGGDHEGGRGDESAPATIVDIRVDDDADEE